MVLPAPGGASITRLGQRLNESMISGRIASTGSAGLGFTDFHRNTAVRTRQTLATPHSHVTKLLPMIFTMPQPIRLAAAAALLSLATTAIHAQDWAKARLEASPRHHEYVPLKHGNRTVQAFVVYPEVKNKAPVVVLIHEIFGLSDWAKEMADELAAQGFIVIAPDLLSGFGPNGGGSSDFPEPGCNRKGRLRP